MFKIIVNVTGICKGMLQKVWYCLAVKHFFVHGREAAGYFGCGCLLGAPPPIAEICQTPCMCVCVWVWVWVSVCDRKRVCVCVLLI